MQSTEPVIRASALAALPSYLKDRGIDVADMLATANLNTDVFDDGEALIPLGQTALLFDAVARRLADPTFGLSYALVYPPGASGLLGQVVMTAPTVRDVFHALERILQVHMTPVEVHYVESGGIARFELGWPAVVSEPKMQITDFYLATLVLRLREATGSSWVPLAADFEHRAPDSAEAYHRIFGTRLTFDRPINAVVVDGTTLAKRMPPNFEGLHQNLIELGERRLREQVVDVSTAARVQTLLAQHLAKEVPFHLEAVATGMGVQARALQWRLGQEHTSYEKVLLATRLAQAEHYLRDSAHQLTRVAELLGFSELSAFTRWSQKHFHMTPSALRQHLRQGGSAPV